MRGKKSTLITTLAVVFSVISLVTAFGVLGISNSIQGISTPKKENWNVIINEVSDIVMDEGAIEVLNKPSVKVHKLSYGLKLNSAQSTAQFAFTISNEGNVDAIVKDIKINGIKDYENNLNINLSELKIGDTIKAGTMLQVKVITNYLVQVNDELMIPKIINLDNIEIDIELEKVE